MGDVLDFAKQVPYRLDETYGNPATGPHKPKKSEIWALFALIEQRLANVTKQYATLADLNADTTSPAGTSAIVYEDGTTSNNALYAKNAGSGWTKEIELSVIAGFGGFINVNGTIVFAADQSMGGYKLTNLGAPTTTGDATPKNYVDTQDIAIEVAFNAADQYTYFIREYDHALAAPKIMLVGDSITEMNTSAALPTSPDTYGSAQYSGGGAWSWFRRYNPIFNQDVWFDNSDPNGNKLRGAQQGISGSTVAQFIAQGSDHRFAECMKQSPQLVDIALGINDILGGRTAAQVMADLTTACRMFTRFGIPVLLCTVRPVALNPLFTFGLTSGDARRTVIRDVNRLIRTFCTTEPLVFLRDPFTLLNGGITDDSDPSTYTVTAAENSSDGLHLSNLGAYREAPSIDVAIRPLSLKLLSTKPNVGAANLLTNYFMASSTFTAATNPGITGFLPADFDLSRGGGTGTAVAAQAPFAPLGSGLSMRFSSNQAETSCNFILRHTAQDLYALAPDEFVYPYASVSFENLTDVDLTDPDSYFQTIAVYLASATGVVSADGFSSWCPNQSGDNRWVLRGPQFKVRSDMTAMQWTLAVTINGYGRSSGDGYVNLVEAGIGRVTDASKAINFAAAGIRGYGASNFGTGGLLFFGPGGSDYVSIPATAP